MKVLYLKDNYDILLIITVPDVRCIFKENQTRKQTLCIY